MNDNLTAMIATERHDRLVSEASAYRRRRANRTVSASPTTRRPSRVVSFLKDIVAASL